MKPIRYVPARHLTPANRTKIALIVIHTAECAEVSTAAENLQTWTAGANASQASWHYAVDNDSITQSVLEKDVAWHAGPVNGFSIGIEHAGRASQDAAGWDDEYSRAVLENSAHLAAEICKRYGIPVVRLSAEDLKAGKRDGFTGHVDVTNGLTGGKGHMDPGKAFPWDAYLARVRELVDAPTEASPVDAPAILTPADAWRFKAFVDIELNGVKWQVCPVYVAPVGIGQARDLAKMLGCELPTPELVDAIWKASDLKIDADRMAYTANQGNDFAGDMNAPETHAMQAARIAIEVGDRALGKDFFLLAGAFKDVVVKDGKIGLYGWHRANGTVVQPFYSGHSPAWADYSQGLRLVRRV
jgi:N-acetyl-anhydromuramyl-L-alanine amidase AmpD